MVLFFNLVTGLALMATSSLTVACHPLYDNASRCSTPLMFSACFFQFFFNSASRAQNMVFFINFVTVSVLMATSFLTTIQYLPHPGAITPRCVSPQPCFQRFFFSFLFKSASSAQNVVLFINFVTGLALMVTSFVLNLVESTRDVNAKLKWVYRLFPGFCLGDGLAQLVVCEDGKTCMDISSFGAGGMPKVLTPLSWTITGADIACLLASSIGEKCLGLVKFKVSMLSCPVAYARMAMKQ